MNIKKITLAWKIFNQEKRIFFFTDINWSYIVCICPKAKLMNKFFFITEKLFFKQIFDTRQNNFYMELKVSDGVHKSFERVLVIRNILTSYIL